MISGINLEETIDFTISGDTDNPTVWKLGAIPSGILAQIGNADKDNPVNLALKVLQFGLRGWSNFSGIEYKTEKKDFLGQVVEIVPMDLINRIPLSAALAISEALIKINHITDTERKN